MATLPENVGLDTELEYIEQPTNTFIIDWTSNQIMGMDAGIKAMRQAVEIILQNERFRWQIYSQNFGVELADLPGEDYEFITSEIPRRIEEAFSVDKRILSVENFVFSRDGDSVTASFDVNTVYGTVEQEAEL